MKLDMNLKYILAAGVIFFCCAVSKQTFAGKTAYNSAGIKAYNSSPPIAKGGMEARDTRVPRAEAVKRTLRAAEHGYASAQKILGAKYGTGQGVPQSDVEAYVWSSIAATSGDEGAINNRDFAASRLSPEELEMAQERVTTLSAQIQK